MPILLTTTIPTEYIAEANIVLLIKKYQFNLFLRFTIFGELLEYKCPEIELPDTALRLTFNSKTYRHIKAEIEYLPYRLLQIAFGKNKQLSEPITWKLVKDQLETLCKDKNLVDLQLHCTGELAKEILHEKQQGLFEFKTLKLHTLLYDLAIAPNEDRKNIIEALGNLKDTRAVEPLIYFLNNEDAVVRHHVAIALRNLGDPRAVEPLIATLNDKENFVRETVASALGFLNDDRAIEPLISTLKDKDIDVQLSAILALAKVGDARAVKPLISALKRKINIIKLAAAFALGNLGDVRAVTPLINALKFDDVLVRKRVVDALGKLSDKRSVKPICLALKDEDSNVSKAAEIALYKFQDTFSKVNRITINYRSQQKLLNTIQEALEKLT